MAFGWDTLKGKKKHPWHLLSAGGKYFCLGLTY